MYDNRSLNKMYCICGHCKNEILFVFHLIFKRHKMRWDEIFHFHHSYISNSLRFLSKSSKVIAEMCLTLLWFFYISIQWNSVITNCLGPAIFVRYNREFIITGEVYVDYVDLGLKKLKKLVRYKREFVITELVITAFDCISNKLLTHFITLL